MERFNPVFDSIFRSFHRLLLNHRNGSFVPFTTIGGCSTEKAAYKIKSRQTDQQTKHQLSCAESQHFSQVANAFQRRG